MAAQYRRTPGKADARLKVSSAIEAVIEAPAGSALAGKVDIASRHVVVSLMIVGFNPRRVRFVAQTEVQRQAIGKPPSVLRVDTDDVGRLLPRLASADTTANLKRKTQNEVRASVSSVVTGEVKEAFVNRPSKSKSPS